MANGGKEDNVVLTIGTYLAQRMLEKASEAAASDPPGHSGVAAVNLLRTDSSLRDKLKFIEDDDLPTVVILEHTNKVVKVLVSKTDVKVERVISKTKSTASGGLPEVAAKAVSGKKKTESKPSKNTNTKVSEAKKAVIDLSKDTNQATSQVEAKEPSLPMVKNDSPLNEEQLSHLKEKGFEPAKNSLGASFVKSETGKYAKESDINKELEDFDKLLESQKKSEQQVAEKVAAPGVLGDEAIKALHAIDSHLAAILEKLTGDKQKQEAAQEEAAGEAGAKLAEGSDSQAGETKDKGSPFKPKNPMQVIIGIALATLIPLIKTLKDFYDDHLKPIVEKVSDFFKENVVPFFTEKLPKFFMEDIPEFFTNTLPEFFKDGISLLKEKIESLQNFFSGMVGKLKEALGGLLESIGDSKAVRFFLGDDNFLKKKGADLKKEGGQQQADAETPKLVIRPTDGKTLAKPTKAGEQVEYRGQKFTVPKTQAELDKIVRKIDGGETVDSTGAVVPKTSQNAGAPVQSEAKKTAAAAAGGGSSAAMSGSAAASSSSSNAGAAVSSGGAGGDVGSSASNSSSGGSPVSNADTGAQVGASSGSTASIGAQSGEMQTGSSEVGESVTSASMKASEPEPVPGTPAFDRLRKKLSSRAAEPTPTNDNTSIPSVFPNLGNLSALLYFNSDAGFNPITGGSLG